MLDRNVSKESVASNESHRVDAKRFCLLTTAEAVRISGGIAGIRQEQLNNKYPECIRGC